MKLKHLPGATILAVGLASSVAGGNLILKEADHGKTNKVPVGTVIEITLSGNPTTGYEWGIQSFTSNCLAKLGEMEYRQDEVSGPRPRVGIGGKYRFKFKAVSPGQADIRLVYRRSWETTACDKVFSVGIDVERKGP